MIRGYQNGTVQMDDIKAFEEEMEQPIEYEELVINEVEKIELLFCLFFTTTTDFSQLDVPGK